jgi:O-antigen ligase
MAAIERTRGFLDVPARTGSIAACLAAGLVCIAVGVESPAHPGAAVAFAIAIAIGGLSTVLRGVKLGARRLTNPVIWVGLIAPAAVTETKTAAQALQNGATTLVIAESAVSVVALVTAIAILRPQLLPLTVPERWLLAYLAAAVASTVWSIAPTATLLKAAQLGVSYALLAVLVRANRARDTLRQLIAVCDVVVAAALIGFVVAHHKAYGATNQWNPTPRLRGVFPAVGPDLLGFLAAVSIVAHIGYRLNRNRPSSASRSSTAILLLDVVALYLAHTRNALALLVVGLCVLYWMHGARRTQLVVRAAMVGLLVTTSLLLVGSGISHYLARGQRSSAVSTLTGRTDLWRLAYADWQVHPVTGLGFYSGHRAALVPQDVTQDTSSNIDNLWLETLVDVGLVGFIPLAAAVWTGRKSCLRRAAPDLRALTMAVWTMCLASSFINPSLQFPSYSLIVFGTILLLRPDEPMPDRANGPLSEREDRGRILPV